MIAALDGVVDPVGLTALYLLAIVPVAIGWGFLLAGVVTVAAFLTYAFFFVPPVHSFHVADSDTAAALVISLVTAYVVSELARRATERAREAQLRAEEAERAGEELHVLADEQAALRRVATLVARGGQTGEVLEAVTREVGLQCAADLARMERFEPDETVTAVAAWSRSGETHLAVGTRFALEGASIAAQVRESGRPGTRRQLRRRVRPDRAGGPGRGDPLLGRLSDRRRGTDLGGDRGVHDARRPVSA